MYTLSFHPSQWSQFKYIYRHYCGTKHFTQWSILHTQNKHTWKGLYNDPLVSLTLEIYIYRWRPLELEVHHALIPLLLSQDLTVWLAGFTWFYSVVFVQVQFGTDASPFLLCWNIETISTYRMNVVSLGMFHGHANWTNTVLLNLALNLFKQNKKLSLNLALNLVKQNKKLSFLFWLKDERPYTPHAHTTTATTPDTIFNN